MVSESALTPKPHNKKGRWRKMLASADRGKVLVSAGMENSAGQCRQKENTGQRRQAAFVFGSSSY